MGLTQDWNGEIARFRRDASGNVSLVGPGGAAAYHDAGLFGASPSATAAVNTTAIQSALDQTGLVMLNTPGVYLVTGMLRIPSFTELRLGAGVTLKLADNSNTIVVCNENWDTVPTTVTSISASSRTVTIVMPATISNAVGDYVAVMGSTSDYVNGIWKIESISTTTLTNDTFTYYSYHTPAASPAGTVTVWPVDTDVAFVGGTVDGNYTNQSGAGLFWTNHAMIFKNVLRLTCHDQYVIDVMKFGYLTVNCRDSEIYRIKFDTHSDGVHISSPSNGVQLWDISGHSGDDLIAFTEADPATAVALSGMMTGGNITNVQVKGIHSYRGATNIIKFSGAGVFRFGDITVDGIFGTCLQNPVSMIQDAGNWSADSISLKKVRAISYGGGQTVLITTTGTINNLFFDDLNLQENGTYFLGLAAGAHINNLQVSNLYCTGMNAALFYLYATSTIDNAVFDSGHLNFTGSNGFLVYQEASQTLTNLTLSNITQTGTSADVLRLLGATTKVDLSNCKGTGLNRFVAFGTTASNTLLNLSNVYVDNSVAIAQLQCGGSINCSNVRGDALSSGSIYLGTSAANTNTNRVSGTIGGSASQVTFNTNPPATLSINGAGLQVDGTLLTTGTPGDLFYNTNAAYGAGIGVYARGAATTTRIAA